ncbi:MAG: hypothetical protein ABGX21_04635, partial [Candidatus Poseidoniia archaeon]
LLGLLSERVTPPSDRHHYMHACSGTGHGIRRSKGSNSGFGEMSWLAIVSHLLLLQVGISFMIVGIRSFRYARLQQESSVVE